MVACHPFAATMSHVSLPAHERYAAADQRKGARLKCICSVHKGWNVIDTASNYRSGRAELAVGHALRSLFTANVGVSRDMLFIRSAH